MDCDFPIPSVAVSRGCPNLEIEIHLKENSGMCSSIPPFLLRSILNDNGQPIVRVGKPQFFLFWRRRAVRGQLR